MTIGSDPIDHTSRIKIAGGIADQLKAHFGDQVVAIGLYGSLAHSLDGPFSDIEMHCVLDIPGKNSSLEWCEGNWKAKVGLYGVNVILKKADLVEIDWAITNGAFMYVQPLHDPTNLFIHLRKSAISQPGIKYVKAINKLVSGEIFELARKIRNSNESQNFSMLPSYATEMARWGACLVGLDNRYIYPSTSQLFKSSLELDNRPTGYDFLCKLVMEGTLSEQSKTSQACLDFWEGVIAWSMERGIRLVNNLEEMLRNGDN
ncbi:MAG TPA: kanamycin nucleotidyltransferase C-terminal domain-containing protein [Anaerolineaceae bacterium]|jgi:kanamycin nucleotidyltransferase